MLLKSMVSDEDIYTTMTSPGPSPNPPPSPPAPVQQADDDDDDDNDVWGSPTTTSAAEAAAPDHRHPSDIPRLRQEHVTSGYREGIAVAKAESVQAGFDEGFGLGATVGTRAGKVLGLLEGIVAALGGVAAPTAREGGEVPGGQGSRGGGGGDDAAGEVARLLGTAREELGIKSIFGSEYWEADGTWKYEVGDVAAGGGGADGNGDGEVVFADVAAAHPLLKKWEALVQAEVERWDVDLSLLSEEAADARDHGESRPKKEIKQAPAQSRDALLW